MSLITSCPACGTMFRVVPDQLKISEGWVRCGHCAEVFDATAHLTDPLHPSAVPDDPVTQPGGLPFQPSVTPDPPAMPGVLAEAVATPVRRAFDDPPFIPPELPPAAPPVASGRPFTRPPWPSAAPVPEPVPVPMPPATPPAAAAPLATELPEPIEERAAAEPGPVLAAPHAGTPSRPAVLLQGDDVEPDANIDQVSFVRQARRKAFWRSPLARVILSLAGLLALAALLLQVGYQDRDRLAVLQPQLRPALEQMCQVLECRIAPPRQIESIVIDSSGFNRLRGDTYRLSFTLRNTAALDVAAPSMELTLTDTQDQPVARRVLTPAEYGVQQPALGAASDWSGAVGLTVAAGGVRIAGYRLLAFYP